MNRMTRWTIAGLATAISVGAGAGIAAARRADATSRRDQHLKPFRRALVETGLIVPMITTNLFSSQSSATAGSPITTVTYAGSRSARCADNLDVAA
jgi:hypothetical protein